jgi:hypothetical protein
VGIFDTVGGNVNEEAKVGVDVVPCVGACVAMFVGREVTIVGAKVAASVGASVAIVGALVTDDVGADVSKVGVKVAAAKVVGATVADVGAKVNDVGAIVAKVGTEVGASVPCARMCRSSHIEIAAVNSK